MVKTKVRAPEPQPVPQPTPQELEIQREQLKLMQKQTAQLDATAPLFKKQLEIMERQLDEMVKNPEIQQEQIELQRDQLELARTSTAYQVKLMEQNLEAQESAGDISKEQLQLQREQIGMARESIAQQESLAPFVLEGMGLVEEPDGSYRRMTEDEFTATLSDTEKAGRENLLLSLERERKALLGELPLSESGQQQKANEFKTFKEAMARAGHVIEGDDPGTAVATTTAGIQSLKAFNERFGLLEEAERRGELTQGSQAVLARAGVASDIGARRTAGLLQFPGASSGVATGSSALALSRTLNPDFRTPADLSTSLLRPDYGRAAGQYAGLLQPYQFSRNLQAQIGRTNLDREFSARQQSAANRSAMWSGLMQAGGTIAGAGLGGGAEKPWILSRRSAKKDIRRATEREEDDALETVKDLKTYTYRYKGESGRSRKRMGLMADNAPASIVTPDRGGLDVGRTIGLLMGATRAMNRKGERSQFDG